jgi:hypothetical protein
MRNASMAMELSFMGGVLAAAVVRNTLCHEAQVPEVDQPSTQLNSTQRLSLSHCVVAWRKPALPNGSPHWERTQEFAYSLARGIPTTKP